MTTIDDIRGDFARIIDAAERCIESYVCVREPEHPMDHFDDSELDFMEHQIERALVWARHVRQEMPGVTVPGNHDADAETVVRYMGYVIEHAERIIDVYDSHRYSDYAITESDFNDMEHGTLRILSVARSAWYHFSLIYPQEGV